jgi:hypothetical protein
MGLYHRATERFLKTRVGGWTALHVMNPIDKRLMKWSNGKLSTAVGTDVRDNAVLLRCTGAKSGKTRDVPLLATPFDDGWALIACATGWRRTPPGTTTSRPIHSDRRIPVMVLVPQK